MGCLLENFFYSSWDFNIRNSFKFRVKSNNDYWAISRNFIHKKPKIFIIEIPPFAIIAISFMIFTSHLGDPYQAKDENQLIIVLLIFFTSSFIWVSLNHSLYNLKPGKLSKHDIEGFYIKFMWGIGLIVLILITLIPFYIMIMTSLKNQQSLILNPLDLSVNLNTDFKILFNS